MKRYLCVDGGTTNTRLSLVCDGETIDTLKFNIGARAGLTDKTALPNALKDGIDSLLKKHALTNGDIEKILASGMITSPSGLVNLPHLTLPVGIPELKAAGYECTLPQISEIPFFFIRGVKTGSQELESADIMRGEETEIFGVRKSSDGDAVYMLMGSHTKLIRLDGNGKIQGFTTTLTGELIASVASGTILKEAFELNFDGFNKEMLLSGFEYANKHGINEALFKTRILKNVFSESESNAYSFFLGACLSGEVIAAKRSGAEKIIIGGKRQLKYALYELLSACGLNAEVLSDAEVDASVTKGQIKIYEFGDKK